MATKKVELRRKNDGSFEEEIVVRSDWDIIDNVPAVFPPEAHTHTVDDIDAIGTPNDSSFLRGDGVWAAGVPIAVVESIAGDGLIYDAVNQELDVIKATTAQAEAGTDDGSFMTPLKTAQAIMELSPPTDISGKMELDGSNSDIDTLKFKNLNTEDALAVGEIRLNNNLPEWQISGNTKHLVGQQLLTRARNRTGATRAVGDPVFISGVFTPGGGPGTDVKEYELATRAVDPSVFAVASCPADDNADGCIITKGVVQGWNTSAYDAGDDLYLTDTAGTYTTTKPATGRIFYVGKVIRAANDGIVFVSPTLEYTTENLGAEPAFTKGTAFNKNFGTTAGTVTEGNDARLSDARTPTAHTHVIADVTGLQTALNGKEPANANIQSHISATNNPHSVTKAQVGLSNVDNVQQIPLSQKAAANGVASLDNNSKVPLNQLPDTAKQQSYVVTNFANLPTSNVLSGDKGYVTSTGDSYIWNGSSWLILAQADWENVNLDYGNITNPPTTLSGTVNLTGNQSISGTKTFTGQVSMSGANPALAMNNRNISGINHLQIADPGPREGLEWVGGSGWAIDESPDNRSNAGGNLQFVTGITNGTGTRRATMYSNGDFWFGGTLTGGTVPWARLSNVPSSFTPSSHTHAAGDITSGSFSVARGGTGRSTLTANTVLVGNGTSAVSMLSRSGIDTRSTFPPATHTHAIADVTNLQTALDGKAATSHTHSTNDITSGTLPLARGGTGRTDGRSPRWITGRTFTVGNTGKTVTGAANVSWSLAEIGAASTVTYIENIAPYWSMFDLVSEIPIEGILATDNPIVDVIMTGTLATDKQIAESWAQFYRAETGNGFIKLYAFEEPATVNFQVQIKVVR